MYPWNETRFNCKLIDESGNFTGKEYAVYFSGSTSATSAGAGNNLLFYTVDAEGNVKLQRLSGEAKYDDAGNIKWDSSALPMDPSLSHMRSNISGQDVTFDAIELWGSYGKVDGGANFYNRSLVFDAEGRMIRGIAPDAGYLLTVIIITRRLSAGAHSTKPTTSTGFTRKRTPPFTVSRRHLIRIAP